MVKLALKYGLTSRKPTDPIHRHVPGGRFRPLRAYASIIGIAFQTVETMAGLAQALEEASGKELMLIDTPGFGPGDTDEAAELALFLSRHRLIEVQLVLPATLRATSLSRITERFSMFQPARLLFTNLDEVGACGGIIEQAIRTRLPLSYLVAVSRYPRTLRRPRRTS